MAPSSQRRRQHHERTCNDEATIPGRQPRFAYAAERGPANYRASFWRPGVRSDRGFTHSLRAGRRETSGAKTRMMGDSVPQGRLGASGMTWCLQDDVRFYSPLVPRRRLPPGSCAGPSQTNWGSDHWRARYDESHNQYFGRQRCNNPPSADPPLEGHRMSNHDSLSDASRLQEFASHSSKDIRGICTAL